MKKKNHKKRKEEITPIIDGDSRPDKNVEPDPAVPPVSGTREPKMTPERAADTDRLEDFKDTR